MSQRAFDVVVMGAGSAGEVCAGRLGERGLEVALTENHLVGGECSYYACMPSKALLRPGELLAELRRVQGAREAMREGAGVDAPATFSRRDEVVSEWDDSGQLPWLEDRGVTLLRGRAALDGERRVRIGDDVLQAGKAVVVATGSVAAMPPIEGLADAKPWGNREATSAHEVPARLLVLGGGVVSVELAQAFQSLGSQVTVVEALERLIAREEPFASEQVEEALRERGVEVRTGAKVTAVRAEGSGVSLELEGGDSVSGDQLLVAVGRRAMTEGIGLESVGVATDGPLEVDDHMRVGGRDWLYAVGDVNGRAQLTHMGKYQARIAADHILGDEQAVALYDGPGSPRVIFTDPEVAAVGHTLASAQESGLSRVRAVDQETDSVAGASFRGRGAPGTCRLVIDEDRHVIIGATFTGPEIAESLHAATIAIVGEIPLPRLWHAVPAFPTRSEVWLRLMERYGL